MKLQNSKKNIYLLGLAKATQDMKLKKYVPTQSYIEKSIPGPKSYFPHHALKSPFWSRNDHGSQWGF